MRRIATVVFLAATFAALQGNVRSQERGFGAGIMIGEPTGFTMKNWLTATTAFDAGLAWSFVHDASVHLHADYLWHDFHAIESPDRIPIFYGIGGRVKAGRDARLGVRGVVGVSYLFRNAPLDAFFELAPIVDITPETSFSLNAALGMRYYFK